MAPTRPQERALIHGVPPSLVEALGQGRTAELATAEQNNAIGSGFHIPSVMLAIILLFQLRTRNDGHDAKAVES